MSEVMTQTDREAVKCFLIVEVLWFLLGVISRYQLTEKLITLQTSSKQHLENVVTSVARILKLTISAIFTEAL